MRLYKYNEFGDKLFESSNIDIVKEICYELTDYGEFEIRIEDTSTKNNRKNNSVVFINKKGQSFYFDEVEDVVYRIKDAIGVNKIKALKILKVNETHSLELSLHILENETIENYNIVSLLLIFYK